eukprot:2738688-Alexandrium_andersonii.AAC.1
MHLMYHMVLRMGLQGNPMGYSTFSDEGMNKVLKQVLKNCHQSTFEPMCLAKMAKILAAPPPVKRKRP